jgi:hypothetical protein
MLRSDEINKKQNTKVNKNPPGQAGKTGIEADFETKFGETQTTKQIEINKISKVIFSISK